MTILKPPDLLPVVKEQGLVAGDEDIPYLDTRNNVVGFLLLDPADKDPYRTTARRALEVFAASIIGIKMLGKSTEEMGAEERETFRKAGVSLSAIGRLLGIELLDLAVIGQHGGGIYSLKQKGLL